MSVIAFRVDASLQIGTGHVMRCLTLADAARESGAQCSFICRPHQGHLLELISERGHRALVLPALEIAGKFNHDGSAHAQWLGINWAKDAHDTQQVLSLLMGKEQVDWLVVDHYALDMRWEQVLRPQTRRIMVIDDLADRPHSCDLLLDQNLGRKLGAYHNLLKSETITLIGPQYALIRPEFVVLRSQSLARREANQPLRRLIISMGGVDKDNATGQILVALQGCLLPSDLHITVVLGAQAPWRVQVQAQAKQTPWRTEVLVGVSNMALLMAESDLAIGAAGSTSWERCCLGLPTIQIVLAHNQEHIAQALSKVGAALMLSSQEIATSLPKLIKSIIAHDRLHTLAKACSSITQGDGAKLVSRYLKDHHEDNVFMQRP
jgi:UDP-2,4-diacetamido-2,4,6-trideoxy-beta-L-altropyranose hydrolase